MKRCAVLFWLFLLLCKTAQAQGLSLIRDEEVERGLSFYLTPLFEQAGLEPKNMRIHLVRDDSINAFAVQGLHVFVHTGLLTKADNAQEVVAVLAHETGHIAGGHIVRLYENMRIARRNMLLSMVLGAVVAGASGRGDAAMGVMSGMMSSSQGLLAGYRRSEENAADETAVRLLTATGHDLSGFADIMRKLQKQEDLYDNDNAAPWRSHPMVRERLALISARPSKAADAKRVKRENDLFLRMKAKLDGFLSPPEKIKASYKDDSLPSRYARAVLAYRTGNFADAERQIDDLIKAEPQNPYFYELKGQLLFETARGKEAIAPYEKAVALLPDSDLFRIGLAQAVLSDEDAPDTNRALAVLSPVQSDLPHVWRLKATAYGRAGNFGLAAYALAEYNLAAGDLRQAEHFARKAADILSAGDSAALKARDILEDLRENRNRK